MPDDICQADKPIGLWDIIPFGEVTPPFFSDHSMDDEVAGARMVEGHHITETG
jgi:hypothetical protein